MRLIDLHCDTIPRLMETGESLLINGGHFDIKRAQQSGIAGQFFSLFLHPTDQKTALTEVLRQMSRFFSELDAHQEYIYPVFKAQDWEHDDNRIAAILHLEGAEAVGTDPELLKMLYRIGLRCIGLTWNHRNLLADGVSEGDQAAGLSKAGIRMVQEIRNLGMLLDLSHIAPGGFYQAVEAYAGPVLVTHANARALCNHPRNLDDHQLKRLADCDGVVGVNQVNDFICPNREPTLDHFLDHVVYISEKIGVRHVALGSDFDGADRIVFSGVEDYAQLEEALHKRGFAAPEMESVFYGNIVRVIQQIMI